MRSEKAPRPARVTTERRHATDAYLRRFGWRIFSRPKIGEPIWERNGERYPQELALQITEREREQDNPR